MGGSDDSSNLIELTVEEHAEAHRILYEEYNNEYDRIAWLSLSGQINISEAKFLAQKEGSKLGAKLTNEKRKLQKNTIGDWNKKTGHVKSIATLESCQKGGSIAGKKLVDSGKWEEIRRVGSVAGGKASMAKLNSQKWKCLECGMISSAGGMGNHQRGSGHSKKELICP
jgi:hypothetical protein